MKLHGKVALITGAAKRIGREIALTLADRGADIVIHYHQSRTAALDLAKKIEAKRRRAWCLKAAFTARRGAYVPGVKQFVQKLYRRAGQVDILVNNASIFYPTTFEKIREKDWEDFISVNLKAPFFLAHEIGKKMKRQKCGKIINLVDWTVFRPNPNFIPYAISKAGLIAASAGLAKALAPQVQVLSLAPGPILPSKGMSAKAKKAMTQKTLLKRFGDPRDIAQTVRFFCEDTDYITGAYIPVDGGASIF